MTVLEFDANASLTRPASSTQDPGRRPNVRIAWLIARFVRRQPVRFDLYKERFGRSLRSYRRDLAALREAGIYLDTDLQGAYRMLCFRSERDAAQMRYAMRNVVPFKPPETFARFGIDWTKDPVTEPERSLREAYLSYESSCGSDGLVSLVLLSRVARRQGGVAEDLESAADFAEIILAMQLRKHQDDALSAIRSHLVNGERYRRE